MKMHRRCKLCRIGFAEPKLLNEIHKKRFDDENPFSLRLIEEEVNRIIAVTDNEKIKEIGSISFPAVQNHFKKHTTDAAKIKYRAQVITKATQNTREVLEVPTEVAVEIKKIDKDRINLYEDLTDLYLLMQNKFNAFDQTYGGITIGGPGEPSTLPGYAILSKELRTCLVELNKMKQSEQLVKNVLNFALQHYTKVIIEEIIRELDNLRRVMAPHIKDQNVVDDIVDSIQHNFGVYITKGASETLQKTNNQFNLS